MQNDGSSGFGTAAVDDLPDLEKQGLPQERRDQASTMLEDSVTDGDHTVLTIVVSNGESRSQVRVTPEPVGKLAKAVDSGNGQLPFVVSPKKGYLSRTASSHEQCRVCQEEKEEDLIDLGCQCRGGLAKAHRSCIDIWFRTRGSNRCEICQQVAANVPPPQSLPSTNYWIWRVDPAFRGSSIGQEHERGETKWEKNIERDWFGGAVIIGSHMGKFSREGEPSTRYTQNLRAKQKNIVVHSTTPDATHFSSLVSTTLYPTTASLLIHIVPGKVGKGQINHSTFDFYHLERLVSGLGWPEGADWNSRQRNRVSQISTGIGSLVRNNQMLTPLPFNSTIYDQSKAKAKALKLQS
ncbi:hypothetical protein L1049_022019 [Liquidambar formosana]|uniref:RING-CH-type domain-containing protein n=1 Tax=Liquidambar formosana TaxID=63359 RepID=A0AAP0RBT4_LIQFO